MIRKVDIDYARGDTVNYHPSAKGEGGGPNPRLGQ
jgi:hypothetical protein